MRPIWHSKEWFSAQLLVKRGTKTPCIDCLKKDTIALYAYCQFVMYRLKIVTHKIYGHGSKSKTVLKETKDRITRFYLYSINLIFCYIYNNSKENFQKALKNRNNRPHFSIKNDKNHITNTNVNEIIFKKKNEPKKKKKWIKKLKLHLPLKL